MAIIKIRLRRVGWLLWFYRKFINKLPVPKGYSGIIQEQSALLDQFSANKGQEACSFTILVSIHKLNLLRLQETIDSVLAQRYSGWELIVINNGSRDKSLLEYFETLAESTQIKIIVNTECNSEASTNNDALKRAQGDFFLVLNQGDLLHPAALLCMQDYLKCRPDVGLVYSDEDLLSDAHGRHTPHFKPNWSPDLLYSYNYISCAIAYKRDLVNVVGGFRDGFDGAQYYDLLLRCTNRLLDEQIVHIPYVLYHCRNLDENSKDVSIVELSSKSGLKALRDHLLEWQAAVSMAELPNTYKVTWPIHSPKPLVSIIIPTKNSTQLVRQCVESICSKTNYEVYEILLIDNNSDDPESLDYFDQLVKRKIVRLFKYEKPFNYSAINNYAADKANGSILVLMNNDIEILEPSWLDEMVSNVVRKEIGCVGAKLYYPSGKIQHAGVICGLGGVAGHSHKYFNENDDGYFKRLKVVQNLSAVTGACLAVRKSVFYEVGGLNALNLTVAFNDVDFCLKVLNAGYRNLWSPHVRMIHHESVSRGAEDTIAKQVRFQNEIQYMKDAWGDKLQNDGYYNPWLTHDREDFSCQ